MGGRHSPEQATLAEQNMHTRSADCARAEGWRRSRARRPTLQLVSHQNLLLQVLVEPSQEYGLKRRGHWLLVAGTVGKVEKKEK